MFVKVAKSIQAHKDFDFKVARNSDEQNRNLAFQKILDEVISKNRKQGLDFYRLYTKDDPFKQAFLDSMRRMVSLSGKQL